MKITSNAQRTVVTHYQTIEIEDGPVISAGDSYYDGTQFRVEKIKINHLAGKPPMTIRVSGPRVDNNGVVQTMGRGTIAMHELGFKIEDIPEALRDVLAAAAAEDHAAH